MARDFNGTNQYLEYSGSAPATNVPMTIAAWFNSDSTSAVQSIVSIAAFTDRDHCRLLLLSNRVEARYRTTDVNEKTATASATYSLATWHHAAGVYEVTGRHAYFDGGNKGSEATNIGSMSGVNRAQIGVLANNAGTIQYFDGRVAEVGVWNVALSDAEIAILAKGFAPPLVRPASLVAYWPLIGRYSPEIDHRGGFNLTLANAPVVASHPRVLYPGAAL